MEVRAQEMGILRSEGFSSLHSTFEDSLSYLNFVNGVGGGMGIVVHARSPSGVRTQRQEDSISSRLA